MSDNQNPLPIDSAIEAEVKEVTADLSEVRRELSSQVRATGFRVALGLGLVAGGILLRRIVTRRSGA